MVYLEAQGDGAVFSSLANGPHPLYVPLLMLVLDCILYLLLAVYLDQVLPGKYTHCKPQYDLQLIKLNTVSWYQVSWWDHLVNLSLFEYYHV